MSVLKNKQRLLHLYRYLMENTDEEHQATTNDLVSFLRQEDANASRKTVKDDIEVLIEEGADIVTTKSYYNSYFIGSRMLEIPEVKMLIDSIAANVSLSADQKEKLIEKLLGTLSIHQAKDLRKGIVYYGTAGNEQFYYNIDRITEAIRENRKLGFQYFDYMGNGDRALKDNGKMRVITPFFLTCRNNRFYVIGSCSGSGTISVFRTDLMTKASILDDAGDPVPEGFEPEAYMRTLFWMQPGPLTEVVLKCSNEMMIDMLDQFGEDLESWKGTADSFYAKVRVCISKAFYAWIFKHDGEIRIVSPAGAVNGYTEMIRKALRQENNR